MEYFFKTEQLAVGYDGKPLIQDIEIRLQKGRILTLIGPNGSGKSTILKTITKHLKSIAGTVYFGGNALSDLTDNALSKRVSVVLTERMKTEWMTCEEVVESGRYPYTGRLGILSAEDRRQVRDTMETVNVADLAERGFSTVSDGQRQRILLARAICQQPEILVLDEPTSYLDIRYELELLQTLRNMAKERGIAVVMSLHELDLAERVSDDVLAVNDGRVVYYGPAEAVFTKERIGTLYGITEGSYNPLFGSLELPRPLGQPEVFVIAGGGAGIPAYRQLQKQGVPFATGILHENDVDYQVAMALASEVIVEKAFEPISDAAFQRALDAMRGYKRVINCLTEYGAMNARNQELLKESLTMGLVGEDIHFNEL